MKKNFFVYSFICFVGLSCLFSCNNQLEEPDKIENTLQSVSYLLDTLYNDPYVLLDAYEKFNEAIDTIGYPDAGYSLWMAEGEAGSITFMVQGNWPDQKTYDLIHNHELFHEVYNRYKDEFIGLDIVEYHKFSKVRETGPQEEL